MKNTFGNSLKITLFGESHGEYIGCVLDGLSSGLDVDEEYIKKRLYLRRPAGKYTTKRIEPDNFKIVSGVYKNKTTGTPLCILIPNEDTVSSDYGETGFIPRPSHSDYTSFLKYNGFNDPNGGGHSSGRLTSALVAASGIILPVLEKNNITVCSHIEQIGSISDRRFKNINEDILLLKDKSFPVFSDEIKRKMEEETEKAQTDSDSIGGITETVITGLPGGLGEPWFDGLESVISHAVFSVPAIKGIEFGGGFSLSLKKGSEANDCMKYENGEICFLSNNGGGIDGGISNGNTVLFRCAVKPTPTIFKEQKTVNLKTKENTVLKSAGRHDPCIALRISPVIDSVTSLCIYDMLSQKYGTDWAVK